MGIDLKLDKIRTERNRNISIIIYHPKKEKEKKFY